MIINRMKSLAPLLQNHRPTPLLLLKWPDLQESSHLHKEEVMDTSNLEHGLALYHTPGHGQDPFPVVHVVYQEAGEEQDPDLNFVHNHSQ